MLVSGAISPEEFAATWGCDASYDKPPNQKGDGNLFYRFAAGNMPKDLLEQLLGAIDRTIQTVQQSDGGFTGWSDRDKLDLTTDLKAFKQVVQERLEKT